MFNDTLMSEPTVSSLNNEIDFRISFDESDDEDYTVIFDKNSFSYKIIYVNDLKTDSENDNEKVNMPSFPPPEPTVNLLTGLILNPQHIDEFDLKDETSLSKCDEEEQNVLNFNDLFPFNIIYPNDSKSDKDNDDDKVDIEHSSGDSSVKPLPDVINTDVGAYAHGFRTSMKEISMNIGGEFTYLEILKCWSLETSRRNVCDGGLEVLSECYSCHIRQLRYVDLLNSVHGQQPVLHLTKWYDVQLLPFACLQKPLQRRTYHAEICQKDHLCPSCQLGKSKKASHPLKTENTNTEVLHTLHMDLCGPMRTEVSSERNNGTEFVNKTLDGWFESVGISHETSVPRSPQQNGVVERRNRTLMEAARTMLILRKLHCSYGLSLFGSLCYPTNDYDDVGKLKAKADIGLGTFTNDFCRLSPVQNSNLLLYSQDAAVLH
ncbi:RNA-directed DNA polymerase, eukaryota [Tanacetum coccineum]